MLIITGTEGEARTELWAKDGADLAKIMELAMGLLEQVDKGETVN